MEKGYILYMVRPGTPGSGGPKNGVRGSVKQKLQGTRENGGSGQFRSQTSPRCSTAGPSARGLSQEWSLGFFGWNFSGRWRPTQEDQCRCTPGYPYPRGLGPLKWCSKVCTAINFRFLGNVHWSKVADLAQVSNGRSNYKGGLHQAWSLGHLGWNLAVDPPTGG